MTLLILAAIAGGGLVGFVAGALFVSIQSARLRGEAALAKVEPVLKSGFAGVSASVCPVHGELDMNGTVASEGEYRALQEKVRFLVGDEEANLLMRGVSVASPEQGTGPARP